MINYDIQRWWYKEADFLQPEHVEAMERFQTDWPAYRIEELVARNRIVHHLGGMAFNMLLDIPSDPSDQVIAVPTGYGGGFKVPTVARAVAIRDVVDPHATLVMHTNIAPNYGANNFSASEAGVLGQGDFQPMRDRLNVALEDVSKKLPDAKVAYAGGSLGAAVVASVLGRNQEMMLPTNGAAIVDPANIADRDFIRLGSDFLRDMPETFLVSASNFSTEWAKTTLIRPSGAPRPRRSSFINGIVAAHEAYHIARGLSIGQLPKDLLASPSDIGIVHMWSRKSNLSPDASNSAIAEQMSGHPLYRQVRINNWLSRHGVTASFALQAAAIEHAIELSSQEDLA